MLLRSLPPSVRARGVTAVLGPTNTGKTHLAIERMLAHESGVIGLPLRLLAREVYGRLVERAGADQVALVTGEEKIKPLNARYWVATVEAMPRDLDVAFCAIDEIQLASDFDRGHVFTDRLLNQRGRSETLIIGAATMRPLVEKLLPGANIVSRPRLSQLSYAGEKKITRLPRRSAVVAFSAEEVYAVAELIRRQKGGAAVVLGALSPRTRNAQVELYQSGDVDYLVATDAIGMGLNLDVDHVAFASERKFDGYGFRQLTPAEFGQIAGRAGRHMRDGTFGTTGRCPPFDSELVTALEDHAFEPVRMLQWRNPDLDFASLAALQRSLAAPPREEGLTRAPTAEDEAALDIAARDAEVRRLAGSRAAVERLWEVCQVPDYRRVASAAHADLVVTIYRDLVSNGVLAEDWFARQVGLVDRTDGDIDTLSARIAQVRTWTFVANRPDWLTDPEHWQARTRQVEDRLSDALHERLASRFVDRRTSVLMRRLRENAMLEAEVTAAGDVLVEGQHVGQLHGFQFAADPQADGTEAKALRAAAQKALAGEIEMRAERLANAGDETFVLANDGVVRWMGEAVARLVPGEKLLGPRLRILSDEHLTGPARDKVEQRLELWLKAHVAKLLGPLIALEEASELNGIARGIAFQIAESLGVLDRARVAQEVKGLDQEQRGALRRMGVRFGAYHLYLPQLLKPAPRALAAQLWALKHGGLDVKGLDDIPHLAASGRTSIPVDAEAPKALYRAAGFRVCGERAVRVDILERLADLIRPAIAYRPGTTPGEPPAGAADGDAFVVTVAMTSLVGCSGEDFSSILKALGYVMDRRTGPAITVPLVPAPRQVTPPERGAEAAAAEPAEPAGTEGEAAAADAAPSESEGAVEDTEAQAAAPEAANETVVEAEAAEPAPTEVPAEAPADGPQLTVESASQEPASQEPASQEPAAREAGPEEAAAADPAEPVLIEVWRPHRHHHHAPQRQGADKRGRRHGRGEAPRESAAGRPEAPAVRGPMRPAQPRNGAPGGGRPADKRADGGQRRGKPGEGRGERRHEQRSERAPDPNSPFAKLLALKQQLESRDDKK
ncbi:ATP-dependent RNA helicase SUPV3L1/SUV3 [Chelatococcus caeni]|uniref:ATP-dependent RNA helicase SUPV3L1/SUV3 n=1 Tax=Chelatococcus caeni TaxID=1348468 RepID=A0A840C086_9HYPH|nr:helicase-related protein [Chelatococcus caeni]MBB4019221.1 ATP-dependent RNA helicase SUPV3L1/SUV3 [Chelatococcus caeni]